MVPARNRKLRRQVHVRGCDYFRRFTWKPPKNPSSHST
jgi:hypothetical protein